MCKYIKEKGTEDERRTEKKRNIYIYVIVDEYYLLRMVKFRLKMKGNVQKYCGKNKQENTDTKRKKKDENEKKIRKATIHRRRKKKCFL